MHKSPNEVPHSRVRTLHMVVFYGEALHGEAPIDTAAALSSPSCCAQVSRESRYVAAAQKVPTHLEGRRLGLHWGPVPLQAREVDAKMYRYVVYVLPYAPGSTVTNRYLILELISYM